MHAYGFVPFAYWWLIFPLMWFVFGIFGMWAHHSRQRAALDLMKTYAEQGRAPAEIAKVLDTGPGYDSRWSRRAWRYGAYGGWRYGPHWAWRRAIMSACVAAGFWAAAYYVDYADFPFAGGFSVVAIIMTIVAAGSLIFAIGTSVFPPRATGT